ncbi:hypothetical protein EDD11_005068 [Mortierella claussenii]|nr:hypothetical protein EDD11_005068 [Mortierella claussenii]
MPPAPAVAQNRGSASPRHKAETITATPAPPPGISRSAPGKGKPAQPPPALANSHDLLRAAVPVTRTGRKGSSSSKDTNAVCEGVAKVQDWLRPYSEPVYDSLDETYRTYAEPYVDQYGRPLYQTASEKAKTSYQYAHPHISKVVDTIYTDNVKTQVKHLQKHAHHVKSVSDDYIDQVWRLHSTHVTPVVNKVSPHAKTTWERVSLGANKAYGTANTLYMKHVNPYAEQTLAVLLDAAGNVKESFAKHTDEIWGTRFSKQNKSKIGRATHRASKKADQVKQKAQKAGKQADKKAKQVKADADKEAESLKDTLLKKTADAQKLAEEYTDTVKAAVVGKAEEIKKAAEKPSAIPKASNIKDAIHEKVVEAQRAAGEYTEAIKAAVVGKSHEAKKAADQHGSIPSADEVKAAAAEKGQDAQKLAEQFIEHVSATVAKTAHGAQKAATDETERLRKLADEKVGEASKLSERIKKAVLEKAYGAQESVARQAENIRNTAQEQVEWAQEAGADFMDSVVSSSKDAKGTVGKQAEHIGNVAGQTKDKLERIALEQAAALKLATLEKENQAKMAAQDASNKAQNAYDAAGQQAEGVKKAAQEQVHHAEGYAHKAYENIKAKVIGTPKPKTAAEKVSEQVDGVKKGAQEQIKKAQELAQEKTDQIKLSSDQFVQQGKEQLNIQKENANKVKDYVEEQAKDAGETVKNKVHDARAASKASLAAMLAGIESTFGQFYEYEDKETKNLWSKLQAAIDEHIAEAKKSSHDLEKANREAYATFESYVRDWKQQGGDLEDRISKLSQRSADSIKTMGQKAEEDQKAAKKKVKVLSNNVEVYLTGLKSFLTDRLAASKETAASELHVFRDTSSEDDEKTVLAKLSELEKTARSKLETAGSDARSQAEELLKQVDEIWSQSEATSRDYAKRTSELVQKAKEDAQNSFKQAASAAGAEVKQKEEFIKGKVQSTKDDAKGKIQSTKDDAKERVREATDKVRDVLQDKKEQVQNRAAETDEGHEPNVRVAKEEPGSGHRHHRHH